MGGGIIWSTPASAHVKWFCDYNVFTRPRALNLVWSSDFRHVLLLGIGILMVACITEGLTIGAFLLDGIDELSAMVEGQFETLFRACYGAFFICLWTLGDIILTPELKTGIAFVPWLQLSIAIGMLWRPTMVWSAGGIVVLYALGVREYGLYHMLDYPIFLTAAAYIAMIGLNRTWFGLRPMDVLRWGAAITLMWASVEKWAYPQWTYPLFIIHPHMGLGFSPPFYMCAAGFVEFSLAFAMLWTPLVRRSAAVILMAMFLGAIGPFGKIDAIGHAPIIIVLLAVAIDHHGRGARRPVAVAPVVYCAALAATIACYYGLHVLLFGAAATPA
ncbi:MAG: hypothetical protein ABI224_14855 [Acetobacteraceae bacterium]